jgi:hypothetical protein
LIVVFLIAHKGKDSVPDNMHQDHKAPDNTRGNPRYRNRKKGASDQLTLKDLSRLMPNGDEHAKIIGNIANMDARSIVLVLSSLVDAHLERAILSCFVPLTEHQFKLLFRNATSPLSSFSAKIGVGYALGIFNKEFKRQ